ASVKLEHLINALTRHWVAADALLALGERTDQLRRDTAAAIASEAAAPFGAGVPVTSPEVAQVLHRAADLAGMRRAPATLHDLIRSGRAAGWSAAELLREAAADPERLEHWRDQPLLSARAGGWAGEAAVFGSPPLADGIAERLDRLEAALGA